MRELNNFLIGDIFKFSMAKQVPRRTLHYILWVVMGEKFYMSTSIWTL